MIFFALLHHHGDFIAFIFKYTYTATRIIINQLLRKCTITRTITFPQLYSVRSNPEERKTKTKEGDEFCYCGNLSEIGSRPWVLASVLHAETSVELELKRV